MERHFLTFVYTVCILHTISFNICPVPLHRPLLPCRHCHPCPLCSPSLTPLVRNPGFGCLLNFPFLNPLEPRL